MLQNMLLTALTPPCGSKEAIKWHQPFTPNNEAATSSRKKSTKIKRVRTSFTTDQIKYLEAVFSKTEYISMSMRNKLSQLLDIKERALKVWFQNRRMKKKKTERGSSGYNSSDNISNPSPACSPSDFVLFKDKPEMSPNIKLESPKQLNNSNDFPVPYTDEDYIPNFVTSQYTHDMYYNQYYNNFYNQPPYIEENQFAISENVPQFPQTPYQYVNNIFDANSEVKNDSESFTTFL